MPIKFKKLEDEELFKSSEPKTFCKQCKTPITTSATHDKYCFSCRMKYDTQIKEKERKEREEILSTFDPIKIKEFDDLYIGKYKCPRCKEHFWHQNLRQLNAEAVHNDTVCPACGFRFKMKGNESKLNK